MTHTKGAEDVTVRHAIGDDLARIVELLEHGSLAAGKEDPTWLTPYASALAEIDSSPGSVLVAETAGEVVGVCQVIVFRHLQARGGLCAQIESVHVHPDRRREGIGHLLMRAAVEHTRRLGCYRVQLTSNNQRSGAHRFYETLGFEPTHLGFKLMLQ